MSDDRVGYRCFADSIVTTLSEHACSIATSLTTLEYSGNFLRGILSQMSSSCWTHCCIAIAALSLTWMSCADAASEAVGSYSFRSYGAEQGLRNQAVTSIAQDNDGFIMVGTEDGLFRYDGTVFQRLGTEEGLPGNGVRLLYRALDGRLWVGTENGVLMWSGRRPDPLTPMAILADVEATSISSSRNGHIAIGTLSGAYEGLAADVKRVKGIPSGSPAAVWLAPDDSTLLVATGGHLYLRDGRTQWRQRDLSAWLHQEEVQSLLLDREQRIWLRGRQSLLRLDSLTGVVTDMSARLPGASVQKGQLILDRDGRIWVPTTLGLFCFDGDQMTALSEAEGLPTQWATTLIFDHEDNLWIASEGVHRVQGGLQWTHYGRKQGLASDTVWTTFRDRNGLLWAGTNRGMATLGEKGWRPVDETIDRAIYSFAEGADGTLWAAGNSAKETRNVLLMRAPGTSIFQTVALNSIPGTSVINSLAIGPDGAVYVATFANGLHRVRRNNDAWSSERVGLPSGSDSEQFNQLVSDKQGGLWAMAMNGLLMFDGQRWHRYTHQDGLSEDQVEALAVAPDGDLLLSYWNVHGISRIHRQNDGRLQVQAFPAAPELFADNIYSMGFDRQGSLWLGTAQGVKRWLNGGITRFGRGEGLPGEDASGNGFWADADGDIWFGMANGLAHFRAKQNYAINSPVRTAITRFESAEGTELVGSMPEVSWAQRTLTFHYSALSYRNEACVQMQVRLSGFEDDWRNVDIHEARYTGLPPGSFQFEVRARADLGQYGPVSTQGVLIRTPWWRTFWFAVLVAAGLFWLVMRVQAWRLARLNKRNLLLEQLVLARTQELEKVNRALEEASMVDPLTGMKNRRFLGLSMPSELARLARQRRKLTNQDHSRIEHNVDLLFLMIDLDHFKMVNDTYGHGAGDTVLKQASDVIRGACREADIIVRWGGEEFLIIARNADRECSSIVAKKIADALREHAFVIGDGVVIHKTCSIGFTAFPLCPGQPEAFGWEEGVELADQCLYAAKNSGRDGWVGVILPEQLPVDPRQLFQQLPALVAAEQIAVFCSFADPLALIWQQGHSH